MGFTRRHLRQRVEEHKWSVIRNHVREQHGNEPCEIVKNSRVLRKCSNKSDCLIFEMFFIRDLKPKLNKKSDSSAQSCLIDTFNIFHYFYSSQFLFILHFSFYCIISEIVYVRNFFSSVNLNLKKRNENVVYFLSLVFITKCFTKNLFLRKVNLSRLFFYFRRVNNCEYHSLKIQLDPQLKYAKFHLPT